MFSLDFILRFMLIVDEHNMTSGCNSSMWRIEILAWETLKHLSLLLNKQFYFSSNRSIRRKA